jgi:GntR family transcriptional regulator, transcriptional repressor for pyruvate dehydrogenase complex
MSFDVPKLVMLPAYKQVSAEIERRIMTGELRPSDVLPSEADLAERFGVNRATVREGIRRLESDGFVRRVSRKRLVISVPQHQELASRGSRSLLLNQVTFNELWQVAMALEPLAAACAATLVTDENLTVLDANLEQTRKTIAAGESPIELDVKFHALVADIAGNKALLLAREPFALLLYPSFAEMRPHAPLADSRLLAAHAQIVAALKRRDGDEASAWMNRHIADFGRGWRLAGLDFDMPIVSADREELDTSLDG